MGFGSAFGTGSTYEPVTRSLVNDVSKFPDPVDIDGVMSIRLEAKEYVLDGDVSIPYPIAPPGDGLMATISAFNRSTLTYTGTDALFRDTSAEGTLEIDGLTEFKAPNGDMWNLVAGPAGFSFQASGGAVRFTNCNSLGTVTGPGGSAFNIFFGTLSDFDQGLTSTNLAFFEINTVFVFGNNQAGCTYFTVEGSGSTGNVNFFSNTYSNGTNETIFDLNTNLLPGVDSINITGNNQEGGINGTVFADGSLDVNDPGLFSIGNTFIPDTKPNIIASLVGNTTATVIAAADTPVRVAGTWGLKIGSQFTLDTATGRLTYNGVNDLNVPITMAFTSTVEGGGSDQATFYVALNGSIVADSANSAQYKLTDPLRTVIIWGEPMSTGDYIEAWVENNDDSSDITVSNATVRLN